MTLRITLNQGGGVSSCIRLDNAALMPGPEGLTPLVLDNLALLKLAPLGDVVDNVGVRLTSFVYIVCELSPKYNPNIEDIMIYLKAEYAYDSFAPPSAWP
jgi:hypothetical protein